MGLGWTRAPVGTAERCRIPLQTWQLASAAHLLEITEFLSIFTATAAAIYAQALEEIALHVPMHRRISRKQTPSATYNFHFHLDGEPPSVAAVVLFFFHYGEWKEEKSKHAR